MFWTKMFSGCFSLWSPKFCYCYVIFLSQHAKAATAEGLTFSDPIHKKSARNLNLYDFCHSLAEISPFRSTNLRFFVSRAHLSVVFNGWWAGKYIGKRLGSLGRHTSVEMSCYGHFLRLQFILCHGHIYDLLNITVRQNFDLMIIDIRSSGLCPKLFG
jgi:hypothetical protein